MDTFAWMGMGVVALFVLGAIVIWLAGMAANPIGRTILFGWAILAAIAWALAGGVYLLWTHGG